jgi:membrane-associated protein
MHLLLATSLLDPQSLAKSFGLLGILAIIFAETGLLIGFFLPGDSLLVLAGLISAVGLKTGNGHVLHFNLAVVLIGLLIAAIAGAQCGYVVGRKAGPALFKRPNSRLFKQEHVDKAQRYFDTYGAKTIVIARFVPVVRTFANPMAGVSRMEPRKFTTYNVVGGLAWVVGVTMIGYVLGKTITNAQDHLPLIEGIIIAISLLPVAYEVIRGRMNKRSAAKAEAEQTPAR